MRRFAMRMPELAEYRGKPRVDVVVIHGCLLAGVCHSRADGIRRRVDGFLLVEYDIPRSCPGAYYPETNPLVPLSSVADGAGTPTSKSTPVLLTASAVETVAAVAA